jgi:hypothetical protein
MRITEVNGAIGDAVRVIRSLAVRSPEVISRIIDRMNYGKAPHHAREYVRGYADGLQDRPEPMPPAF